MTKTHTNKRSLQNINRNIPFIKRSPIKIIHKENKFCSSLMIINLKPLKTVVFLKFINLEFI